MCHGAHWRDDGGGTAPKHALRTKDKATAASDGDEEAEEVGASDSQFTGNTGTYPPAG